ncbi:MAG: 50S ribosomal protein L9 [Salinisphaera sp.]|nr:50S ribosomal protein L9 [Salinisphaera sp.]
MQVILLQKVRNLGGLGDTVRVRPGYGRNYLVPKGIALVATPANLTEFEQRKSELLAASKDRVAQATGRAEGLRGQSFTVAMRASDEGRLYGSVGPQEIARVVVDAGHELDAAEVSLPDGAIRQTGYYQAILQLHAEVEVEIEVAVAQQTDAGVTMPPRASQLDEEDAAAVPEEEAAAAPEEDDVDAAIWEQEEAPDADGEVKAD